MASLSISSVLAIVCGLFLGVALTLQLNKLLLGTVAPIQPGGTEFSVADRAIALNKEKNLLRNRLNDIERELQHLGVIHLSDKDSLGPASLAKIASSGYQFVSKPQIAEHVAAVTKASKRDIVDSGCAYDFKVYVYDIPKTLAAIRVSEEARKNLTLHVCHKCILEQFSLEYIINDFFLGFCGRTYDPNEADFFYLPLVRDAEFRQTLQASTRNRAPSLAESALLGVLEKNDSTLWHSVFNVTDKYWFANHGADHIIAMPAPVTNIRHETSQRGFFHYMIQLLPPIFLCLEYSLGFVQEYPVCSQEKNIVVPYPTTDPELYNGKLTNPATSVPRDYLLYYAGGMHGDCVEVRKAMKFLMINSTHLPGVIPPVRSNQAEREHGFLAAKYCPVPIGDSPSSKRMYDVLNFGCVPVVLSDDLVWAYSDQTGGPLNHSSFSLQIPQSVVHFRASRSLEKYRADRRAMGVLPSGLLVYELLRQAYDQQGDMYQGRYYVNPLVQILQRIPAADYAALLRGVRAAAPYYRYYQLRPSMDKIPLVTVTLPDGGAIETMARRLSQRRKQAGGVQRVHDLCMRERFGGAKHKYISRFYCDGKDKKDSLVRRIKL
jgi:hypothetical protein